MATRSPVAPTVPNLNTPDEKRVDDPTPALPKIGRLVGAAAIALLALFLWAYWPTLAWLFQVWNSSPDYSHGYLVLPLAAWFLWRRRNNLPESTPSPSWTGLSLIALAAATRLVSARYYLPELDGWSIPLWLAGACWLFGGARLARWAAPALAFLVFMVPLPASLELLLNRPLQALATTMSTWTLQSLGQPAIAEGTTILLDDNLLEVERACSGLRMFYGILALAVAYMIVTRARLAVSLVLLAAVAPVAILANMTRITLTGLLYQYVSGEAARHFSHDMAGILMILVAVALFALVVRVADRTLLLFRTTRSRALLRMAVVLLVIAAIIPCGFLWHENLRRRTVDKFLRRADQLEESGEYVKAIDYLDRYLRVRPDDIDVHARIAKAADRVALNPLRKLRAMELYRETWELDPSRIELAFREGQLAVDLARFDEAMVTSERLAAVKELEPEKQKEAKAFAARLKALALMGRSLAPDAVVTADEWKAIVISFQEAIRENPHNIELPARLADIYHSHLNTPAEAVRNKLAGQVIDAMVARNSDRPEAWLARYVYRRSLNVTAPSPEADADLDKALEIGRQNPSLESGDVLLYAGQRAVDRKDLAAARKFFERATEVQPGDHRGWLRLGELIAREGTDAARTKAVAVWDKGLQSVRRNEVDLILPVAATLVELGRFADAEERLRPLDAALPRLVEPGRSMIELSATRLRAGAAAAKGNHLAGATLLRNVLNATREGSATAVYRAQFADAWMQLGDYYSELKFDDQAIEAYESAGIIDPDASQWRAKAAEAEQRNGRPAEAVQNYRQLVRKDPGDAGKWLSLARASFLDQVSQPPAARNWQEFRSAFETAVRKKGNTILLYLLDADYAAAQGQLDHAAKVMENACARVPKSWELLQAMAIIQQRRGAKVEVQKALAAFEKCAPHPEAAPLLKARLDADAGHFDAARNVLEASLPALSEAGKTAIRKQLVELDLRQGNRASARRRLEEDSIHESGNLQVLDLLAQVVADDRDWKALEQIEDRLKKIEGDDGTLWREYRARRLLSQSAELDDPRFREADRLTREIAGIRPNWERRYVLQGVIARQHNQLDESIQAYQQAIRLGNRSIALSEELIDLLNEQHRFTEADREFQRVQQSVARSSRLSSVAIPIYVRRGESEAALRLAEDWVKRQPDDAASQARLGRTILLTTPEGAPEYSRAVTRAQNAYERAVELAPTDVRMWIGLFRFYTGVQKNVGAADTILNRLAGRIDIPQVQKQFVLAQLYESIGKRSEAGRFYLQAIKGAPEAMQTIILQRAAQFFVSDDPAQAEAYCRQVLKRKPKSVEARRTLVRALAEQGTEPRMREAAEILTEVGRVGGSTAADRRLEAMLLARTGRNEDRQKSIELLEGLVQIPQQAASQDRVLLASLYESDHRLLPAQDQYRFLCRQEDAAPIDLVRYAEFLYRNADEQPQFFDLAEPVLTRLERDPQNELSPVRLRLQAAKKLTREPLRQAKVREIVDRAAKRFITDEKDAPLRRETFSKLLILLVRAELPDEGLRLVKEHSPSREPLETAIALADALTMLPPGSPLAKEADGILRKAVDANPRSADLLYSVANFRFVSGARNEAVDLYRRSLEIEPGRKLTINNLALALGDRPDGLAEALKTAESAIGKFGSDPSLLDTKGQILVASGRAKEGLAVLIQASASQGDPVVLLHLANAYLAAGRPAEARAAYRRARAHNVASLVVTPGDRTTIDRLETHVRQTAAAGG